MSHLAKLAIAIGLSVLLSSGCGDGDGDVVTVSNAQAPTGSMNVAPQQQSSLESAQEVMQLLALGASGVNATLEEASTLQDLALGLGQLAGDQTAQTTSGATTSVAGPNGGTLAITRENGAATLVFDRFGTRKGGLVNGTLRVVRSQSATFTITFTQLSFLAAQAEQTRVLEGTATITVTQPRPDLAANTTYNLVVVTGGVTTRLDNVVVNDAVSSGALTRSYTGNVSRSGAGRDYSGTLTTPQAFVWTFGAGQPLLSQGELRITGTGSQFGSLKLEVVDGKVQVSASPAGSTQLTQVGTLDPARSYAP